LTGEVFAVRADSVIDGGDAFRIATLWNLRYTIIGLLARAVEPLKTLSLLMRLRPLDWHCERMLLLLLLRRAQIKHCVDRRGLLAFDLNCHRSYRESGRAGAYELGLRPGGWEDL
jgi:hypothetical protein